MKIIQTFISNRIIKKNKVKEIFKIKKTNIIINIIKAMDQFNI